MTFHAIIAADTFESYLGKLTPLVDEAKLHVDPDSLSTRAVDPANVGMVDEDLDDAAFESYSADGGVMGANLSRLTDVVGMADAGDLIELELDQETRKLHINFDGLEYTLALIDPDSIRQEPDLPDLDLTAEVVIEGRDINRAVTAADMVSDHIALGFDVDEGVFYVDAEGDTDDVHLELGREDLIDGDAEDDAYSLFSLDYLKDMNKSWDSDTELRLELGQEFPVKIHHEFADGKGQCTHMLAPRIQSD